MEVELKVLAEGLNVKMKKDALKNDLKVLWLSNWIDVLEIF